METLYKVRRSKRAKRLALRLDPVERVFHLVIPERCSLNKAISFADHHEKWMTEKLFKLPETVPFIDGNILPIDGQDVRIKINYDIKLKKTNISLINNELIISTNKDNPENRIKRYLKAYAKDLLHKKSQEKSISISKKIKNISIRDTKSRWGSCSAEGSLSYSWRLIFAPPEALDYVVAHEVAHLVHLNHSKEFWNLCKELSTDFSTGSQWMKVHGHELMKYGGSD